MTMPSGVVRWKSAFARPNLPPTPRRNGGSGRQHALAASEAITGPVSAFLDLDCTSPLRLPEDINGALTLYETEHPDMVMSVCEARKNPYFNLVEPDATGALHVSKPLPGGVWARQDAPVVYEHVGMVYVVDPRYLGHAKTIYEGRVIPYVLPAEALPRTSTRPMTCGWSNSCCLNS